MAIWYALRRTVPVQTGIDAAHAYTPGFSSITGHCGLKFDDAIDDAEQDAKTHLESRAGMGRMRAFGSIAAKNRADAVAAGAQLLLCGLHDAQIDLVAGFDLDRVLGAQGVILHGGAPNEVRRRLHLHGLAHRRFDHVVSLVELVAVRGRVELRL